MILRAEGPVQPDQVVAVVASPADQVRRSLRKLVANQQLVTHNDGLELTAAGRDRARRLLRAHGYGKPTCRETGTPAELIHDRAHVLEHVHDEEAVDYLDDKRGHPLLDPHGAAIPEDFVHLVPGEQVKCALLRVGHQAIVRQLPEQETLPGWRVGMRVVAGDRQDDGRTWTFKNPEGELLTLDHRLADLIFVELEANDAVGD